MDSEPLVYIILVNYNGYYDTLECVHSFDNNNYTNYKIVVVDNCSKDSAKLRNDAYLNNKCEIIFSSHNGGFSYANNLGITHALKNKADFIVLLNNDTVVPFDFIKELLKSYRINNEPSLISCRINYYTEPDKTNFCGGYYNSKKGMALYYNPKTEDTGSRYITFATGCMFFIPKKTIEVVGLLDENYFMYGEDTDYCLRIVKKGLKIFFDGTITIYHKISSSSGNNSDFTQYYIMRNSLNNVKKYSLNKPYSYLYHIYWIIKGVIERRKHFKPNFWGYLDFIGHKQGKFRY